MLISNLETKLKKTNGAFVAPQLDSQYYFFGALFHDFFTLYFVHFLPACSSL